VKKKPTLVMYSGGQHRGNERLHRALVHLASQVSEGPLRFTYLPFCADGSTTYFMRSARRYGRFGVDEFCSLAADQKPTRAQIKMALRAHIVYLAGGNTFYFLKALRKSGLLAMLRDYAESGGIIAGLSAGAHILTPHIRLAGVKGLDPDPNEVRLKDLRALGLAPFEILPHFDGRSRTIGILRRYSCESDYPVYACPDGAGVVVRDGEARTMGRGIRLFSGGIEIGL
jgi:dipeptidase E